MRIRLPADWMVPADERVLEYLYTEGPKSPSNIARDDRVDFSRTTVNTRLLKLAAAGLVNKDEIGRGIYEISDKGEKFLTGEFDARDLPDPDTDGEI